MTASIAINSGQNLVCSGDQKSFFDQLALLEWRHSTDVLKNVREVRRGLSSGITEAAITLSAFDLFDAADFKALASLANKLDYKATTATGAIVATCNWNQSTSVDNYLDLFEAAAQGKALNTPFQFQSFLNSIGVDGYPGSGLPIAIAKERRISLYADDLVIMDGGHCYQGVSESLQDIWIQINYAIKSDDTVTSAFEILNLVRENLITKIKIRRRRLSPMMLVVPNLAPSTHEWVHCFVLWTGISPPEQVSVDVIGVRSTQKPTSVEKECDIFCRREDRSSSARSRRPRYTGRNRRARRSTNRHFVGRRKPRRGAVRWSWANCQNARCQAA